MLAFLGIDNKKVAKITGNTPESIRNVTQTSANCPRWLKFGLWMFETHILKIKED